MEFDADGAPEESGLIRFFREELRPSIKAQMDQRGRELDSWDELVAKTIDAEAKTSLQPSMLREINQHNPRGNRPSHTFVVQPPTQQGSLIWDPRHEPLVSVKTTQALDESTPSHFSLFSYSHSSRPENISAKASNKKSRKERKEQRRQDQGRGRNFKTPTTGVDIACTSGGARARKDLGHITCFNCGERSHYADKCPEARKDHRNNVG